MINFTWQSREIPICSLCHERVQNDYIKVELNEGLDKNHVCFSCIEFIVNAYIDKSKEKEDKENDRL